MAIHRVLERLDKLRQSGHGRWMACCPAHSDKSPSLSIREADDGRILLHCFAGCSVDAVLDAIGLSVGDLFAEPLEHVTKGNERRIPATHVLDLISREASIVVAAAGVIARGELLTPEEAARVTEAAERIQEAARIGGAKC